MSQPVVIKTIKDEEIAGPELCVCVCVCVCDTYMICLTTSSDRYVVL